MSALDLTRDGIIAALAPAARPIPRPNAIDRAEAAMERSARRWTRTLIADRARWYASTPSHIARLLYGRRDEIPPVETMLEDATDRLSRQVGRARAGHLPVDWMHIEGLRAAVLALRYLRRFGRPSLRAQLERSAAE